MHLKIHINAPIIFVLIFCCNEYIFDMSFNNCNIHIQNKKDAKKDSTKDK